MVQETGHIHDAGQRKTFMIQENIPIRKHQYTGKLSHQGTIDSNENYTRIHRSYPQELLVAVAKKL